MPLYMDVHKNVKGMTAEDLAGAHEKDLKVQDKHGVEFLKYWFNKDEGTIFCLCNAPSKDAAIAVHEEAHGAGPDEIFEVVEGS
jgi:hypothetical protein